jgi:3-hydroxybutyryl-CoA dehydrogenase
MSGHLLVVGAGLMGSGIAQVAATAGWQVTLQDSSVEATTRGLGSIESSLARFVAKDRIEAAIAESALKSITTTTDLDAASEADIVVEAVYEKIEIKTELFLGSSFFKF